MSASKGRDFIRQIVADDVAAGRHGGRVLTRFPPEPNGFLHLGHASAICLNFQVAEECGGSTNLRMDDTNPVAEDPVFVEAIARDIEWLGFSWAGKIRFASDYFEALYRLALRMIRDGFAYVDSQSGADIRHNRGTVRQPGRPGPHRTRSVEENLDLFRRMRAGEFGPGDHVLRAKIDLASPNMKLRDPLMYRIRHDAHHRTGTDWPIYPLYDWAHGQSDAIEGITHSFCTLEFRDNRALYDWFLDHTRPAEARIGEIEGAAGGGGNELGSWEPRPRQYEFARRNVSYTIVSKRRLLQLVNEGFVEGWDDPRMPTLAGMRRRGIPPSAIRSFARRTGIGKADNRVDVAKLEWAVREQLNRRAPRVMCVIDPLEMVIRNFPEGEVDWLEAPYFPEGADEPTPGWPEVRRIPFTRRLLIERTDFAEDPPTGFKRLAPGREVRLRHGFFVTCEEVEKDTAGHLMRIICRYDPRTRHGVAPDGRRPSSTIHWVSATHATPARVRLYDRLFEIPDPAKDDDFRPHLNPTSLKIMTEARIEPSVKGDPPGTRYQFERLGYFVGDSSSTAVDAPVFNRTARLKDVWARREARRAQSVETGGRDDHPPKGRNEQPEKQGADSGRADRDRTRATDAELRSAFTRLKDDLGLGDDLADLLTGTAADVAFLESALAAVPTVKAASLANWIVHEVRGVGVAMGESQLEPAALARLVDMVGRGTISRTVAKDLLSRLVMHGGDPREIVRAEALGRISDAEALQELVGRTIAAHPREADRYRAGQLGLAGFFVGQVIRETKGRADPNLVGDIVKEQLK